MTMGTT